MASVTESARVISRTRTSCPPTVCFSPDVCCLIIAIRAFRSMPVSAVQLPSLRQLDSSLAWKPDIVPVVARLKILFCCATQAERAEALAPRPDLTCLT